MNQSFFKISQTYTDKNNLFKELREWIRTHDGTLLRNKTAYSLFKKEIKAKVQGLNRKYSRCNPVDVQMYSFDNDKGNLETIMVSGSWTAHIYNVQHIY